MTFTAVTQHAQCFHSLKVEEVEGVCGSLRDSKDVLREYERA